MWVMRHLFKFPLFAFFIFLLSYPSFGLAKPRDLPSEVTIKEVVAIHILKTETGSSIRLLGIEPTRKTNIRRKALNYLDTEVLGKTVKIAYDRQRRDEMGRWLVYVTLPTENMLNEELIWRGYAYSSKKYPCKFSLRFKRYEKAAKKSKHGLWEGI